MSRVVLAMAALFLPTLALLVRIAQVLRVPAGAEGVPEPCPGPDRPLPPATGFQSLRGMTGREALDALVGLDPRYRWVESDGVIVVRPIEAWSNRDDFLNRTTSSFAFGDENMYGAVAMLKNALGSMHIPSIDALEPTPTPLAARRFSVSLGATSVYEALNAIVRSHGELAWMVEYCLPQVSYENSLFMLMTFDLRGTGWRGAYARRSDGTLYVPCTESAKAQSGRK